MSKLLTRLGVAGALTAAAVWAIHNQEQIAEKLLQGAEKAKELTDKGVARTVTLVDGLLTKANDWLDGPTVTREPAEKPEGDEYAHTEPLLDDGREA